MSGYLISNTIYRHPYTQYIGGGLSSSQVKWKHWLEVVHDGREVGLERVLPAELGRLEGVGRRRGWGAQG